MNTTMVWKSACFGLLQCLESQIFKYPFRLVFTNMVAFMCLRLVYKFHNSKTVWSSCMDWNYCSCNPITWNKFSWNHPCHMFTWKETEPIKTLSLQGNMESKTSLPLYDLYIYGCDDFQNFAWFGEGSIYRIRFSSHVIPSHTLCTVYTTF